MGCSGSHSELPNISSSIALPPEFPASQAVGLKEDYICHNDNGQLLATKGLH